jgi:hypothetical protein
LTGCLSLRELPTSIGQLNALQNLNLKGCSNLQELPTSIGQLNGLQKLELTGCSSLQELPTSIGQLNALQIFIGQGVRACKNYVHLLGNWVHFKSLIWEIAPNYWKCVH